MLNISFLKMCRYLAFRDMHVTLEFSTWHVKQLPIPIDIDILVHVQMLKYALNTYR